MQLKFHGNSQYGSHKLLQKCTSMPSISDTASSNNSIESNDEEYRRSAIKWILAYNRKVTRDTQYLAVAYLNLLTRQTIHLNEDNYEKVALTTLLVASKMNEIYPPKISQMLTKCRRFATKDDIIAL